MQHASVLQVGMEDPGSRTNLRHTQGGGFGRPTTCPRPAYNPMAPLHRRYKGLRDPSAGPHHPPGGCHAGPHAGAPCSCPGYAPARRPL